MRPIEKAKKSSGLPEIGTALRIKKRIAPTEKCGGFLVKQEYLKARRPSEDAQYAGWVAGAGGDVWWIRHQDGSIGAYSYDEITDIRKK